MPPSTLTLIIGLTVSVLLMAKVAFWKVAGEAVALFHWTVMIWEAPAAREKGVGGDVMVKPVPDRPLKVFTVFEEAESLRMVNVRVPVVEGL